MPSPSESAPSPSPSPSTWPCACWPPSMLCPTCSWFPTIPAWPCSCPCTCLAASPSPTPRLLTAATAGTASPPCTSSPAGGAATPSKRCSRLCGTCTPRLGTSWLAVESCCWLVVLVTAPCEAAPVGCVAAEPACVCTPCSSAPLDAATSAHTSDEGTSLGPSACTFCCCCDAALAPPATACPAMMKPWFSLPGSVVSACAALPCPLASSDPPGCTRARFAGGGATCVPFASTACSACCGPSCCSCCCCCCMSWSGSRYGCCPAAAASLPMETPCCCNNSCAGCCTGCRGCSTWGPSATALTPPLAPAAACGTGCDARRTVSPHAGL
mmetsp:Transcript_17966/g.45256  ORF Transcript_17966/g.45256 Transcript_17966/m.45256 type:complete len:327 (+) Transcript_17966:1599-2579(+)